MADNWRNYDPFSAPRPNFAGARRVRASAVVLHLDSIPRRTCFRVGHRLEQDPRGHAARHVQPLQLLQEALEVVTNARDGRGPARERGVAADVVSAGQDQRRHLHRRRVPLRRQRRGSDPPRRGRDLGDLDGEHARRMAARASSSSTSRSSRRWPTATSSRSGERIEQNNAAIAAGNAGEFGRTITLKLLQAEVPVHYLFNLSRDRMAEAVNLGVEMARAWCRAQGITSRPPVTPPAPVAATDHAAVHRADERFRRAGAADFQKRLRSRASRRTRSSTSRFTIHDGRRRRIHHRSQSPHGGDRHRRLAAARRQSADRLGRRSTCSSAPSIRAKKEMRYRLFSCGTTTARRVRSPASSTSRTTAASRTSGTTRPRSSRRSTKGTSLAADEPTADLVATGIIQIGLFEFLQRDDDVPGRRGRRWPRASTR